MAQVQRFDPFLLAECKGDEVAQLHQLGVAEVVVQLVPESIVGRLSVEDDGFGVGQSGLLAIVIPVRVAKVEQLRVAVLGESLLSGPDRTLDRSVLAVDRLRDEDPAQLLEAVLDHAILESGIPSLRERT